MKIIIYKQFTTSSAQRCTNSLVFLVQRRRTHESREPFRTEYSDLKLMDLFLFVCASNVEWRTFQNDLIVQCATKIQFF